MVLLCELCGFGVNTAHAQCLPGDAEEILRAAARDSGVWLVPGSLYARDGDAVYNTTPVIDPDGKVLARSHQMFPIATYACAIAPCVVISEMGIESCRHRVWPVLYIS